MGQVKADGGPPTIDGHSSSAGTWTRRDAWAWLARWLGLAYLWLVLGGNVWLHWQQKRFTGDQYRLLAALGAVVVVVSLLSRRWRWPIPTFGVLIAVWVGAGALSSWGLTGDYPGSGAFVASLICAGLFFGVAATRPSWAGWSIVAIGTVFVWMNLLVYWKTYYSLGSEFTGAGGWFSRYPPYWTSSLSALSDYPSEWPGQVPTGLPYPASTWDRAIALVRDVPSFPGFSFDGLTGIGNYTADCIAPYLVFTAAFVSRGGKASTQRVRAMALHMGLAGAIVGPGVFLLYALDARTALVAVLVALTVLMVPLRWSRNVAWATVAAVGAPLVLLVPPLVTVVSGVSFTGRDCMWESWAALVGDSPLWGVGPPGFLGSCGDFFIVNAHNELLQSLSFGGLIGLVVFVATFGGLVWWGVRFSDRDARSLVVVMTCLMVLLGLEVISTDWAAHWVVAIAARSLSLMAGPAQLSTGPAPPRSVEPG